jgi:hypothetical protein
MNPKTMSSETWSVLSRNIKEITFPWWGWARKTPKIFGSIAKCPNLKVLNLRLTPYAVGTSTLHHRRQHKHQDNEDIKKFSRANGFDALLELRGLEKVIVSNYINTDSVAKEVTPAEIAAFEAFLMSNLTKPKPQQSVSIFPYMTTIL